MIIELLRSIVSIWALVQCGVNSATGLLCLLPYRTAVEEVRSIDRPFFVVKKLEGWKNYETAARYFTRNCLRTVAGKQKT